MVKLFLRAPKVLLVNIRRSIRADSGRNPPLLDKIFLNKGGGFGPFRLRTPDFGPKSGVLPLETAKIPIFSRLRRVLTSPTVSAFRT